MSAATPLTLYLLAETFGICRLERSAAIPAWALEAPWMSITRTSDELSVVCPESSIPDAVQAERGWRALRVAGVLDFSLIGVLASLTAPLAQAGVSVFAVSTYDTDYLLIRAADLSRAMAALRQAGHQVMEEER